MDGSDEYICMLYACYEVTRPLAAPHYPEIAVQVLGVSEDLGPVHVMHGMVYDQLGSMLSTVRGGRLFVEGRDFRVFSPEDDGIPNLEDGVAVNRAWLVEPENEETVVRFLKVCRGDDDLTFSPQSRLTLTLRVSFPRFKGGLVVRVVPLMRFIRGSTAAGFTAETTPTHALSLSLRQARIRFRNSISATKCTRCAISHISLRPRRPPGYIHRFASRLALHAHPSYIPYHKNLLKSVRACVCVCVSVGVSPFRQLDWIRGK
jgi:hypothetical protein